MAQDFATHSKAARLIDDRVRVCVPNALQARFHDLRSRAAALSGKLLQCAMLLERHGQNKLGGGRVHMCS